MAQALVWHPLLGALIRPTHPPSSCCAGQAPPPTRTQLSSPPAAPPAALHLAAVGDVMPLVAPPAHSAHAGFIHNLSDS
jgi:hypothetical protein